MFSVYLNIIFHRGAHLSAATKKAWVPAFAGMSGN